MKRDLYLDKFIKLLEQTAARAHKDLERERKRVDFIEGKVERLELVVMAAKSEAGREYAERSDKAATSAPRKTPITEVPIPADGKIPFKKIRETWNGLTAEQQEEAMKKADLIVEEATKERAS
jgi:predicted dinucleotide-utilizing enzyme